MNDTAADHPDDPNFLIAPAADPSKGVIDEVSTSPLPWWRFALLAGFIGLVACSNVANGVWAKWVRTHPARLLVLSSRIRFLLFTRVEGIGAVPYVAIGAARLAVAALVCYGIGHVYEGRALGWFRRFLGMSHDGIENLQKGFAKASWALIPFFVGSNIVCALAGLNRVRLRIFAPLLALGIAGRLALFWFLADPLEKPLRRFVDFSQRYQVAFIVGSIALVVIANARNLWRGR